MYSNIQNIDIVSFQDVEYSNDLNINQNLSSDLNASEKANVLSKCTTDFINSDFLHNIKKYEVKVLKECTDLTIGHFKQRDASLKEGKTNDDFNNKSGLSSNKSELGK